MKRAIILFSVLASFLLTACGETPTSQPAAPDKSAAPATAKATAAPAKTPQVLLDITGSGTKDSQTFQAGGNWDLNWEIKDTSGYGGLMQVFLYDAGSNNLVNIIVNDQVPANGSKSDVTHQHQGGKFYLKMNAVGDWHVKVTG